MIPIPKISKSLRSRQDNGALKDHAVRRDWFSETQLRDGHKKDEGERKGMKSLGGSQGFKNFSHLAFSFQRSPGRQCRRAGKHEAWELYFGQKKRKSRR